uniref:Polyadenylate-binding protein-interacting protein 2 n=2 Tax=Tetraodon nigroviridis TaxID=99883 RepID=H3C7J5_TETNG
MKDPQTSCIVPRSSSHMLLEQQQYEEEPFAEYMWMEHEEEYNRHVEEELWEEEFIERCVLELLEEEEQWEWFIPSRDLPDQTVAELQDQISVLVLDLDPQADHLATGSSLNPNAKEFVPGIQKHVM